MRTHGAHVRCMEFGFDRSPVPALSAPEMLARRPCNACQAMGTWGAGPVSMRVSSGPRLVGLYRKAGTLGSVEPEGRAPLSRHAAALPSRPAAHPLDACGSPSPWPSVAPAPSPPPRPPHRPPTPSTPPLASAPRLRLARRGGHACRMAPCVANSPVGAARPRPVCGVRVRVKVQG